METPFYFKLDIFILRTRSGFPLDPRPVDIVPRDLRYFSLRVGIIYAGAMPTRLRGGLEIRAAICFTRSPLSYFQLEMVVWHACHLLF